MCLHCILFLTISSCMLYISNLSISHPYHFHSMQASPSPTVEKAVATGAMSKQASTITLNEGVNRHHLAFKNCSSDVISLVLQTLHDKMDRNKDGKITMNELLQGMVGVAVAALASKRNTRWLSGLIVALLLISIGSVFTGKCRRVYSVHMICSHDMCMIYSLPLIPPSS